MWKSLRCAVALGALGLAVFACTAGSTTGGTTGVPQKQAQITSPASGLVVTATISAVTLGDECAPAAAAAPSFAGDCAIAPAPIADGGAEGGSAKSPPSNVGGCGGTSYCQQSNVQIAFNGATGQRDEQGNPLRSAKVEIVSVTLLDATSGKVVDTLKASHPQSWTGNAYGAWDETISPAGDLKASYDLTAPAWSTLSGTSDSRTASTYSAQYKLLVTLRIDGVEITLESADLSREPPVAT
jgi:hypothetical protein